MGYTTEFEGAFKVTPALSQERIAALTALYDEDIQATNPPGAYCQWIPSDDGEEIEWDGEEKFYHYDEWLKVIIDEFLAPCGYKVNGRVRWQGEDVSDCGWLVVKDNVVSAIPIESSEDATQKLAVAAQLILVNAMDRDECFADEEYEGATVTDDEGRIWYQDWYHLHDALRAEAIQNILTEVM
jgi:hypothetical protein